MVQYFSFTSNQSEVISLNVRIGTNGSHYMLSTMQASFLLNIIKYQKKAGVLCHKMHYSMIMYTLYFFIAAGEKRLFALTF